MKIFIVWVEASNDRGNKNKGIDDVFDSYEKAKIHLKNLEKKNETLDTRFLFYTKFVFWISEKEVR